MTLRDVHLDPDLVTDMLGHPALTPSLHSHNICSRQTPHTTSVQLVPLRRSLESAVSVLTAALGNLPLAAIMITSALRILRLTATRLWFLDPGTPAWHLLHLPLVP
jgi:hypothetical protein